MKPPITQGSTSHPGNPARGSLAALAILVTAIIPAGSAVAGPIFYLDNGAGGFNAYELEVGQVTQVTAFSTAAGRSFPGAGLLAPSAVTGNVTTVRSATQNTLLDMIRGIDFGTAMWLGLTDDPALVPGASEAGDTSGSPLPAPGMEPVMGERGFGFKWQSGDPFTFQNWGNGEPNNFGSGEGAVEMNASGVWNDNAGNTIVHPYIVEYKLNLPSAPAFLSGTLGGEGTFAVDVRRGAGQLNNVRDAQALFRDGTGTLASGSFSTINFVDPEATGGAGKFGTAGRTIFPGDTAGSPDDDFALTAHGTIRITLEADYTFGFSGDDGSLLRIQGATFLSKSGLGTAAGDTLQFDAPTGDSNTLGVTHLTPGDYPLEFTFFERGGGAFVELYAGQGVITDRGSADLHLIGDTANGGLALVPEPASFGLLGFGAAALLARRRRA